MESREISRRFLAPALAALLLLGGALAAFGVAPKAVVDGPSTRATGRSVILDARKSVSDKVLQWKLIGRDDPLLVFAIGNHPAACAILLDPDDGIYDVALTAIGKVGEELEADTVIHRVVVGPPAPPPQPVPPPGPTPTPTPGPVPPPVPSGEVLHVTLVLDVDANDPAQAALRTSPKVRDAATRAGVLWRSYDDDAAVVAAKNLGTYLQKAGGPPALIAQGNDGRVLGVAKATMTEDQVVAWMRAFRGN